MLHDGRSMWWWYVMVCVSVWWRVVMYGGVLTYKVGVVVSGGRWWWSVVMCGDVLNGCSGV